MERSMKTIDFDQMSIGELWTLKDKDRGSARREDR